MERVSLNGNDWFFKEFVGSDWVWRDSIEPDTKDIRWWYKAKVPGTVLDDLWHLNRVPDPYFELNSKLVEWVPARTWVYRKSFFIDSGIKGKKVHLCFDGIDYSVEIFLNGKKLGRHEGMFIPCEYDVTDFILSDSENLLTVVIEQAPHEQPQVGKTSLVRTNKTRMNYGWDFCPRMIHQGIWDSVYLKITGEALIHDVYLSSKLTEDYTKAVIEAEIEAEAEDSCKLTLSVNDTVLTGNIVHNKAALSVNIENPKLWQPNGYGKQYRYDVRIVLYDKSGVPSDQRSFKYGIREIKFENNERCNPDAEPFVLVVNGRRIYINGYNWVPIDVMYGVERPEKLNRLIRLAKEANTVMFRVWGGGLIEKDSFYETCAENGILVWQEFIQSSSGIDNKPPEDETYINMMCSQAENIIKRKRNHTALAIWCGGNELTDWKGNPVKNSDPLIAKLKALVERFDPQRRWLSSSPSGGVFLNSAENIKEHPDMLWDVHGPWEYQGLAQHYKLYNIGTSLLHSEFGVEGMTNKTTLEKTISKEHMLPANKDNEIYFHRGAWWINEPLIQETFNGLSSIDEIRTASQYMQYEGLKYAIECNRRRAFQNSGTFPWQFNEPYPNAYCTSSVDYYANPKPVYFGVRNSYNPLLVSASFESPSLFEKPEFFAEIFISTSFVGEEIEKLGCLFLKYELIGMDGERYISEELAAALPANGTLKASEIKISTGDIKSTLFILRLKLVNSDGDSVAENEYMFTKEKHLGSVFLQPEPDLEYLWDETGYLNIRNKGINTVLFLFFSSGEPLPQSDYLYFGKNYFCLVPGEERIIPISTESGKLKGKKIFAESFNYKTDITLD